MDEQTLEFEKNQHKIPEKKKHWRSLAGKEFLVAEEFGGRDVTLTISEVVQEELQNERGKEKKLVLKFKETDRKIACNVTNAKAITEVVGSGFISDWIGQKITFYAVNISAFGKQQEAIRVRS